MASAPPPTRPSLDLVRSLTDEHVLRALMDQRLLTRAQLATRTGISKPTASESVRRLTEAGLLRDTGERTTGRGRVGSYYALAAGLGVALVISIAPEGIVAETVDVHGDVTSRASEQVGRAPGPAQVARRLRTAAERALAGGSVPGSERVPVRLAVVSAADPVDRGSGRLVHLPDSPFLVGELSPADVLAPLVTGPVTVDNDVHWAARAERRAAGAGALDDFGYLHLDDGLGCAVVSDGEVRRGHSGVAGEIAHLLTQGPGGRAVPFIEVFAELGLRRPGSTAIDSAALLAAVRDDPRVAILLADAVRGVLAALVALTDPALVVLGGSWGSDPLVLGAVTDRSAGLPRHVPLRAAAVTAEPSISGARQHALGALRDTVVNRTRAAR